MDENDVRDVAQAALSDVLQRLRAVQLPRRTWTVFRPLSNGFEDQLLPGPHYEGVRDPIAALTTSSPAVTRFLDSVWGAGAHTTSITRDDDVTPGRDAWDLFATHTLLYAPLCHALWIHASRSLAETGTFEPWALDQRDLERAASDVAAHLAARARFVTAVVPVGVLLPPNVRELSLGDGVALQTWSPEDRCTFLTRYSHYFSPQDILLGGFQSTALYVEARVSDPDDNAATAVCRVVDLVKWCHLVSSRKSLSFGEGPIVLRSPSGWRGRTLFRADHFRPSAHAQLDDEALNQLRQLHRTAAKFASCNDEFHDVVHYLGRSLVAPTPRDSLLEAAIGLEMLLVPDAGESTYKFRLHGSAVLAGVTTRDVHKELGEIYSLRSKAAHGSAKHARRFPQVAPTAREILAQALQAVIVLDESNELRLADANGDIGKAVAAMVRARAAVPMAVPGGEENS